MLIPVPFFKIWVIFLPSNFCPMGYWKKTISTNSWDNVSPSPCNFHWMSLKVFCYSSNIAWNKKKLLKTSLPLISNCKSLNISCFSKILVVPIHFDVWRQKLKNLLDFPRAWKPTLHLVPLSGSTHVLSSSVNVILDTLFLS